MSKVLCIALVLLSFVGIFAQEKTIGKDEFDAVYKNARSKRADKSYRATITFQKEEQGKPATTSTMVVEFVPPSMRHIVYQSTSDNQNKKREAIRIKDKTFVKEEGTTWKETALNNNSQSEDKSSIVEEKTDYKFTGSEKLNNKKAAVYEKIENRKRVNAASNTEIVSNAVTKYWFGEDGLLLKSEQTAEIRIGAKLIHTRLTKNYEMNPNIKIEAPQTATLEK